MNRVSVIIPCYKDAATLGRALDSVYAQTRAVDEVVVVNDCSPETEHIELVLQKYPDVIYERNLENFGLAATRNRGLEIASGDIVSFLDADDEYHPRKIELQLAALVPGKVVTCQVRHVWPGESSETTLLAELDNIPSRTVIHSFSLQFSNSLNGAGLMAPRSVLLRLGGYDSTLRSCEDFDLWLRMTDAGIGVIELMVPLYLYYFNPLGLSKNHINISYWELEVVKKHMIRRSLGNWRSLGFRLLISFWLLKHLIRSELVADPKLRQVTLGNYSLLRESPVLKGVLIVFNKLRIQKMVAPILKIRRVGQ